MEQMLVIIHSFQWSLNMDTSLMGFKGDWFSLDQEKKWKRAENLMFFKC